MRVKLGLLNSAVALGFFSAGAQSLAAPAQIVIIRHGEKPATGNQVDLQGCERSYLLPAFFRSNSVMEQFGAPAAFYASKPDNSGGSVRPVETISPTAQSFALPVLDPYTRLDYSDVASAILSNSDYEGRTVVLAWEHDAIPGLAQAFGLTLNAQTKNWPDVVFDEAWVLQFSSGGVSLQIIPEDVIPGDNPLGGLSGWQNPPDANPSGQVPASVAQRCATDDAIDALANSLAQPPLP